MSPRHSKAPIAVGAMRNQCVGCGAMFRSVSAFDLHRVGRFGVDRRCRTEPDMLAAGLVQGIGGDWQRPAMPPGAYTWPLEAAEAGRDVESPFQGPARPSRSPMQAAARARLAAYAVRRLPACRLPQK